MNYPNFANYGYRIIRELGHNRAGGRVTYLAEEVQTGNWAVVKQFQFAKSQENWSEYNAYEQEIQVLRDLDHPGIPRYLDSFQTPTGFCMVQEYKSARSLGEFRDFTFQTVKQIAISVLEILHYLQSHIPPVIHRDLKPENILVDDRLNVYLVDFGFARLGGGEVAVSSVVKGTLGFMPPEQMFNRQITVASDLYSLGATLICLLTKTPSTEVGKLIDDLGRIQFKNRLPELSFEFESWLQNMVEPNLKARYQSAEEALDVLLPLTVVKGVKPSQFSIVLGGTLALVLGGIGVLAFQLINPSQPEFIASSTLSHSQSWLSHDFPSPESRNSLAEIRLNPNTAQTIYFNFFTDGVPEQYYEGMCRILDPKGNQVYVGKFPLLTSNNSLSSWCFYEFDAKQKTGVWTFEFYVDGEKRSEQQLNVMG